MTDPSQTPPRLSSTATVVIVLVAFGFGFVSGTAFTRYRNETAPAGTTATVMPPPEGQGPSAMTPEKQQVIDRELAAVEARPEDSRAWVALGNAYYDADRPTEAIVSYRNALAIDSSSADVWTDLGVMHRRAGEFDKALDCFARAVRIDPRHSAAYFNKGVVLLHDQGDHKGAAEAWEQLLAVDPNAMSPTGRSVRDMVEAIRRAPN